MYLKIKLNDVSLIFSVLLSSGCNVANAEINPHFNKDNQSGAFFDNPVVVSSASEYLSILEMPWDYPSDLKHIKLGNITVSNCQQLKKHISDGFYAAKAYEHALVSTQSVICSMWEQMGVFKSYNISYMDTLRLDKDFAAQAPARFALLISDDQTKQAEFAASWSEVSKIKAVKSLNNVQSTYYDYSGSIQRLTLMAKGDYNGDGIEDQLLYMENSVEGGSYSSAKAYIITRMMTDAPIKLLKEI